MKRLLIMTSGGLLAAGLAVLPMTAFAQSGTDAKMAAPVTAPTDAKTPAHPVKPAGVTVHPVRRDATAMPGTAKTTAPASAEAKTPASADAKIPASAATKTVDHSKS